MDPSRLNCCPPFAIRPRFGTPAVADQDYHDDDQGVDDDEEGVSCHARWFLGFPGRETQKDFSKVVTRLPTARGMRGPQMEIGFMVTDRPPCWLLQSSEQKMEGRPNVKLFISSDRHH